MKTIVSLCCLNAFQQFKTLFSVAPEFTFLFSLKPALDSLETIALVVHDVVCPWQVIPFCGPQLPRL